MDRRVRDAQFASHLRDGFSTGLGQPHRFLLELFRVDLLSFCQNDPLPDFIESISALGTLSNRGRLTYCSPPRAGERSQCSFLRSNSYPPERLSAPSFSGEVC
jgi:hypothetical protein